MFVYFVVLVDPNLLSVRNTVYTTGPGPLKQLQGQDRLKTKRNKEKYPSEVGSRAEPLEAPTAQILMYPFQ